MLSKKRCRVQYFDALIVCKWRTPVVVAKSIRKREDMASQARYGIHLLILRHYASHSVALERKRDRIEAGGVISIRVASH